MTPIAILDNGGETFDRYTFLFDNFEDGNFPYWGSSENPTHPQGFGQFGGEFSSREEAEDYLANCSDKQITALDLPPDAYYFYRFLCREGSAEDVTEQFFFDAAHAMRERGYAIAIFDPDEIPEGQSTLLEDSMVEAGRHILEALEEEG
jgi:hypothetical protein